MKHCMIVDSWDDFHLTLASILRRGGYSVTETNRGAEALEFFDLLDAGYVPLNQFPDVVYLDWRMWDVPAVEIARRLRLSPVIGNVPLMVVTSASVVDLVVQELATFEELQISYLRTKMFLANEFLMLVNQVATGELAWFR